MLAKLLKYEIKATGRIFLPLFLALLLFATITKIISSFSPGNWSTSASISMFIYIIIMVGMFVTTFLMMIQRFYKNLLSDEGYLMFTLPVKPWQHIVSKLLISMLWIVSSSVTAFISILIITLKKGDIATIAEGITLFYTQVFEQLGISMYVLSSEIIVSVLVLLASFILIIYASIAVGHLFNRHKMLSSFGAFIALTTLTQIIITFVGWLSGNTLFSDVHVNPNDFLGMQQLIQLSIAYGIAFIGLLCAAYFAVTNYILSKRLNLE